ncbi:hypothetical protein KSF78_0005042 [Schistosoma japonicum]|nr:hypothetical protein KSF78_0005042 [Schistosoma japonicum]
MMYYLPVFSFIIVFVLFPNTYAKKKSEAIDVPFHINKKGDMVIDIGGVKFSLNSKLILKVDDGESHTKIDFARPTPEELKNMKGTRKVTDYFDDE